MADIYQTDPNSYYSLDSGASKAVPKFTGNKELDQQLAGMTDEERQQYIQEVNAPLTGEDVAALVANSRQTGYRPTADEVQLYAEWAKKQNHDILTEISQGFGHIMHIFGDAAGEFIQHPLDSTVKLPASVAEGFFQGGRNLYGMLAEAQDPNSPFFRFKTILTGDGSDKESMHKQFLDAMDFNNRTQDLEEGKSTLVVDKDLINHKVMIASSFIADPTLLVPYVGEATGLAHAAQAGMRAIGIGERMAKLTALAGETQNKVLGGALKWGVGTPVEFMGGAVRNTIDYGTAQSGRLMEAATGLPMSDWRATMRLGGLGTMAAEAVGIETGIPYVSSLGKAQLAGTFGQGLGQAVTAVGDQMIKQSKFGRGMLSYAGQALKDTERAGIALSPHAKNLLTVIDAVDPLFSYSNSIIGGAAHGAGVGAVLGWGSGNVGAGIGAGLGLGAVGGGMGRVMADVSGHTFSSRLDVQSKMVLEGWKGIDDSKSKAEAWSLAKEFAKSTGDQKFIDAVNGYIAGVDVVSPRDVYHILQGKEYTNWAESQGYDANTKHFQEITQQFKDFGLTREESGKVNSILRDNGNKFAGDSDAFREHMAGEGKNLKYSKTYESLSENAKKAVDSAIDRHDTLIKDLADKRQTIKDFYGNMSAAEKFVDDINGIHKSDANRATLKAKEILDAHRDADGKLTERGKIINDKLRAEGYTDKDGNVAPRRNMHRLDMTNTEFNASAGFVTRRESDGRVHVYLNLENMRKTTFPHELFHSIMRETPMKDEWQKRLRNELLGSYDDKGNLIRKGSVNLQDAVDLMKRYVQIDPAKRHADIDAAVKDYQQNGTSKKLADSTIPVLEQYLEEFGAYYFSHWLNSKPADYLFHGGELTGFRGMLDRVKDGWLDYWENKMSNTNPEFNFKTGNLDKAFSPDGKRIRVGALDAFSRDFLRATANSNRGKFDPQALSPTALRDFAEGNGIYTASERNKSGRTVAINEAQYDRNRIAAGKEIFKVLDGLDPAKRGTKTIEMDGKKFITGRFSEAELDAIVKSGHRNRAWADKHQQLYSVLDGKGSNVIEFGYLGRTAQIGDFSWPRLTGKQVPFKNRSAILVGMESHIGQDGNFYTVFHTLDKAVIDARGNDVWKNPEARKLWADDRGSMEQDFFAYLANASKADNEGRVPSAVLLEKGDGLGAQRRDWMHQMVGIHKDAGDSYFNKPIAEIPEGIRHSVTSFNMDGATNFRVADGGRFDVNDTAIKDLSRNFQPKDMDIEETPNGKILTHASGWKIVPNNNGKATAYNKAGKKIGTYDSVQKASETVKQNFQKLYSEVPQAIEKARAEQDKTVGSFQPALTPEERQQAFESGDLFSIPRVRAFTDGIDNVLRQTRQEFILQKATEAVKDENGLFERFKQVAQKYDKLFAEQMRLEDQEVMAQEGDANISANDAKIELEKFNKQNRLLLSDASEIKRMLDNLRDAQGFGMGENPARYIAEVVKGNIYMKNWSGLLEQLFADGYDSRIETGKPFVAVSTHGTNSVDLMQGRLFLSDKLATNFDIPSSRMGSFSAGSQDTSKSYARVSPTYDIRFDYVAKRVLAHDEQGKALVGDFYGKVKGFFAKEYDVKSERLKEVNEEIKARKDLLEPIPSKLITEWGELSSLPIYLGRDGYANSRKNSLLSGGIKNESLSLPEWFNEYYNKIKDFAKANDIYEGKFPDKQMQLRTLIKMENPYVVVDPRSYEEHWISPHMKEALKLGHDGIVFKRFSDPADRDTIYVVFKDHMDKNIMTLETAWDEGAMPRGNDENGARVMNSVDLGLHETKGGFQPKEEVEKAAKNAGYTYKGYHITNADFNEFDLNAKKVNRGNNPAGAYFSTEEDSGYEGKRRINAFIKLENPWNGQFTNADKKAFKSWFRKRFAFQYEGASDTHIAYLDGKMNDMIKRGYFPSLMSGDDATAFLLSRGYDGWKDGSDIAVFKPENIKSADELTYDDQGNEIPLSKRFDSSNKDIRFQPKDEEGGIVYDQNSKKWKSGFIGLYAIDNPEQVKGMNLQFFKKQDGSWRVRLTDNSRKGESADVGHITASISGNTATLSSHINEEYRGNKLSYVVYSEMAERLRAMGITKVEGTIVNPDGVPVKVRERIIGDTRDMYSGKPISQMEAAIRIKQKQELVGSMGGVDVENDLYPQGRYMPHQEGDSDWSKSIADAQRDKPESAMVKVQHKLGGGLMSTIIEHAGDILHRTYERININNGSFGYDTVKYKVDLALSRVSEMILNKDEFRRNAVSNFANNKNTTGTSEQHLVEVKKLLKDFGDAHAELPAHNELQRRVKALNVALGNLDFNSAHRELKFLETKLVNKKTWTDFAKEGMSNETKGSFAPKEGGRTYADSQLESDFIGKYAQQNPHLIRNLDISYVSRDGEGVRGSTVYSEEPDLDTSKFYLTIKDKRTGDLIGEINAEYERNGNFFNGKEDNQKGLILRDISVNVQQEHRGKGYQHLLYSELLERARASGAIGFTQNVENKLGLPLKSIRKIVGNDGSKIWTLRDWEPVEPTQENFDRLMSMAPQIKDYRGNHQEYVQNNGALDHNAHYQPRQDIMDWKSERTNLGSLIKNSAGYVISEMNGKFRVYNPYKMVVGIYDNLDKAKQTVIKDSMKGQKQ